MTIPPEETAAPTYETDFHAWLGTQARLLREGRLAQADVANIAEELESLGNSDRRALKSHLRTVLMHLLKWNLQLWRRTRSWEITIRNGRRKMADVLADSPSLKPWLAEVLAAEYARARKDATIATGLAPDVFPLPCPFTLDQVLDEDFLDLYGKGEEERHDTPA